MRQNKDVKNFASRPRGETFKFILLAAGFTAVVQAADPAQLKYQSDIRPMLEASCFKCHNANKKKGGVDFSAFTDDKSILKKRKVWQKALAQIETMEMPPEDEKPLAAEQREKLQGWIKYAVSHVDCNDPSNRNPGRAVLRRLNRTEYNLTIRDLLGIDFDAGEAVGFPEDGGVTGYANLATTLNIPPALMEKYFAAAEKVIEKLFDADPKAKKEVAAKRKQAFDALFFVKPGAGVSERDAAKQIMAKLAKRAYRRPVQDAEVDRLMTFYDRAIAKGEKFEAGVRAMMKPLLVAPFFLFRIEQDQKPQGSEEMYRVSEFELASRLSYFIWSSMPDDELFTLAEQKKLWDPKVLEAQVKRMLADPKSKALTENFGAQWLQLSKLAVARPSTEFFPTFKGPLRKAMYDETYMFFDNLRGEDRSVLELLDADYSYLNEDLAKHYNIPDVKGAQMRKVALKPEYHRGGLLAMASMLSLTSHTSRTSPTLRGRYILDVVFGTPPPPPPPDAGNLKEEKDKKAPKTFREQLDMHAAQAACAACHKKMDPLGFALENFDAIGAWRETLGGKPMDATGQLPTGEKFTGPSELKQLVLKRQEQFVHNLSEQMLMYALGRELQYYDECPLSEIKKNMAQNGHKFSSLILGVVNSLPFQNRRNTDSVPEIE